MLQAEKYPARLRRRPPVMTHLFALGPEASAAIVLSLRVSFWAMLCSLPFALATAVILARCRFWGKSLFDGVVHLPLVLPPVVTGYVLLLLFGHNGPLGRLFATIGVVFAFRWTGAALAAAVTAFPLMVRAIRLSLEAIDRRLEEAAATLGANRTLVFLAVTLPLTAPGILAGMVLSFARSLGEFGATITFVSNIPGETRTIPLAIYTLTQTPGGDPAALRLSAIAVLLSLLALVLSELFARRLSRRLSGD
jgi:molybdate transport system permease protein